MLRGDGVPAVDPAEALANGLRLQGLGDLAGAVRCFRAVPPDRPEYPEALHSLALVAMGENRLGEAEDLFRKAIELAPGRADYHYNLGILLSGRRDWRGAADSFRKGLSLRPQDAQALDNLGNALLGLGDAHGSREALGRALKYDRSNPAIRLNYANACAAAGFPAEAEDVLRKLLIQQADDTGAMVNLAALLLGQWRLEEAATLLERAVALQPDMPEALANLGVAWRQLGRTKDAEALFRRCLEMNPASHEAWNGLAVVLHDQWRLDDAAAAAGRALELKPEHPSALLTLANIERDRGDTLSSIQLCRRAVALAPASPEGHWNLALGLLARGELEEGFREFEWRLQLPQARQLYRSEGAPLWSGEVVAGKRLLLRAEQGLGDTLQFVRYVPLLVAGGMSVVLECQPPLKRLLAALPGVDNVVAAGEATAATDWWCPLMSLPHRCGTTLETVPATVPYLAPPAADVAHWAGELAPIGDRPRVGLVWAGAPRPEDPESNRIDRRRSLRLDEFAPLLAMDGIQFFSLQKGEAAAQLAESPFAGRLADPTAALGDMADTAALLMNLDLLISVDTSVAHLAGALGRPVWLLSRWDGCWRWLEGREDSPWYPTLRLFRQERPLHWGGTIARLATALAQWRDDSSHG